VHLSLPWRMGAAVRVNDRLSLAEKSSKYQQDGRQHISCSHYLGYDVSSPLIMSSSLLSSWSCGLAFTTWTLGDFCAWESFGIS